MASINPQYAARTELADQYKAQQAEKDELQAAHEAEINRLKKSYASEKANLEDHFESGAQAEKSQGYDRLRNLKSQINREERNLESTRRTVVDQKTDQLRHDELAADTDGRARVKNAIEKYTAAEDFERKKSIAAENEIRTGHKKNAETILNDSQKRLDALALEKTNYLDEQKTTHAAAMDEIKGHYMDARTQTEQQFNSEAKALQTRVDQTLNDRRVANAKVLEKFDTKNEDPFYQIKRFESDLLDVGDAFVLRVKVPEYERKQFKVEVAGQEIQLKGVRSSDETAKLEPGRTVGTRSFQAMTERYSLSAPVDGRSMSYVEDGEWLEYTLPKFGPNHRIDDATRKTSSLKEDLAIGKELNFKDTLPVPDLSRKGGSGTMG
jgi:HSP20 family molecular chaperone IbpA